ncbi:MAG: hypothetical protein HW399_358 [Dehalococcoidia bacterium]|nr:hypothetical protein [Dehalococcoidia bacterium]
MAARLPAWVIFASSSKNRFITSLPAFFSEGGAASPVGGGAATPCGVNGAGITFCIGADASGLPCGEAATGNGVFVRTLAEADGIPIPGILEKCHVLPPYILVQDVKLKSMLIAAGTTNRQIPDVARQMLRK